MSTPTASQQIEELEQKIRELRHQAIAELKEQLAQARKNVSELESQLAQLTGEAVETAPAAPARRTRRASISDEELKPMILKAMAQYGTAGLNAKEIAGHVGQDPLRIRKFIVSNPATLKRQGSGPGTRFFLR